MSITDKNSEISTLKNLFTVLNIDGSPRKDPVCKRTQKLIAGLTYTNSKGVLHNDNWAYKVPFAFCNALDIELSKLQKMVPDLDEQGNQRIIPDTDKQGNQKKDINGNPKTKKATKPYYYAAWTQGCLLNFSHGHFFESLTNSYDIQVVSSIPVSTNNETRTLNDGQVTYTFFKKHAFGQTYTVTQFEFLKLLIHGLE